MAAGAAVPDSGGVRGQQSPQVLVPMRLRGELTMTAALRRRAVSYPPSGSPRRYKFNVGTRVWQHVAARGSPYPAPPAC